MPKVDVITEFSKALGRVKLDVRYYKRSEAFQCELPDEIAAIAGRTISAPSMNALNRAITDAIALYDKAVTDPWIKVITIQINENKSNWAGVVSRLDSEQAGFLLVTQVLFRRNVMDIHGVSREQYAPLLHDGTPAESLACVVTYALEGIVIPYTEEAEATLSFIQEKLTELYEKLRALVDKEHVQDILLLIAKNNGLLTCGLPDLSNTSQSSGTAPADNEQECSNE